MTRLEDLWDTFFNYSNIFWEFTIWDTMTITCKIWSNFNKWCLVTWPIIIKRIRSVLQSYIRTISNRIKDLNTKIPVLWGGSEYLCNLGEDLTFLNMTKPRSSKRFINMITKDSERNSCMAIKTSAKWEDNWQSE